MLKVSSYKIHSDKHKWKISIVTLSHFDKGKINFFYSEQSNQFSPEVSLFHARIRKFGVRKVDFLLMVGIKCKQLTVDIGFMERSFATNLN